MVERKYYTPAEAAQVANISKSDILHFIETDQLPACLLATRRQFIIVNFTDDGELVATGTATFTGLFSVHNSWIQTLLEKGEIVFNTWGLPIYPSDFQAYSPQKPFKSNLLPERLSKWQPTEWEKIDHDSIRIFPCPVEMVNPWHNMDNMLKLFQKSQGVNPTDISGDREIPQFVFDFNLNGKFELKDLRITASELNTLIHPDSSEDTANENAEKEIKLIWCRSRKRNIQIDPIIERLFILNPGNSYRDLWELLENDIDEDNPQYDLNGTVTSMDSQSLEWVTTKGDSKSLNLKTFINKISEIRDFYKNHNSQNSD